MAKNKLWLVNGQKPLPPLEICWPLELMLLKGLCLHTKRYLHFFVVNLIKIRYVKIKQKVNYQIYLVFWRHFFLYQKLLRV